MPVTDDLKKRQEAVISNALKNAEDSDATELNKLAKLANQIENFDPVATEEHARNTYPITDPKVIKLAKDFLEYKRGHGSKIERELYENMSVEDFITRLLTKRPLMFMMAIDKAILRDGTRRTGGFEHIGSDKDNGTDHFSLREYISYDEMEISSLIGVSSPTRFINDGNRDNIGQATADSEHETYGIYVGQVGARFERPGRMEWRHMLITPEQNRSKNGYGENAKPNANLERWKKYYDVTHFPSYKEAQNDTTGRFLAIQRATTPVTIHYLNKDIYKKYIKAKIETYLAEANKRGKKAGKMAYVHAVGLGTGAWAVNKIEQEKIMIEAYLEVLKLNKFSHIADVNFGHFDKQNAFLIDNANNDPDLRNKIKLHLSERNPADKLTGDDAGKLLVAQYAWDGNSKPGNEYYQGSLSASGDPAAACCSQIHFLQDGEVNSEFVNGNNLRLVNANQHQRVATQSATLEQKPTPPPMPPLKPTTPAPTPATPKPVASSPAAPSPAAPVPAEPKPVTPIPAAPTPAAPKPAEPTPVAPAPAAPKPAEPKPAAPTPVAPTPAAASPVAPTPAAASPVAPTPAAASPVAPAPAAPKPAEPTPVAPKPVAPTPVAASPVPPPPPAPPVTTPTSTAPGNCTGKITTATNRMTTTRDNMIAQHDVIEKALTTAERLGWRLDDGGKATPPHFDVKDDKNNTRFQIFPAEIKTHEDNIDTFKAMLECYKAANPGKTPTITAYNDNGMKLWEDAVKAVYGGDANKIKINKMITPAASPAPASPQAPTTDPDDTTAPTIPPHKPT